MPHKGNHKGKKSHGRNRRHKTKVNPTNTVTRNVHYRPPKNQFHVKLNYSQRTTTATAKGTAGLVNYLDNLPLYIDAFYQIYNYSKILAVDMHIEVINLDAVPYDFVLATMPQSEIAAVTIDQAKQTRGAVVRTVGSAAGNNKLVIRKHYNVEQVVGYHLADRDTRMNIADARSASYSDTALPAILFWPSLVTGASTLGVSISVVQTYHIAFFDLYVPAASTLKDRMEHVVNMREASFEAAFDEESQDADLDNSQELDDSPCEQQEVVVTSKNVAKLDKNSKPWFKNQELEQVKVGKSIKVTSQKKEAHESVIVKRTLNQPSIQSKEQSLMMEKEIEEKEDSDTDSLEGGRIKGVYDEAEIEKLLKMAKRERNFKDKRNSNKPKSRKTQHPESKQTSESESFKKVEEK